MIKHFAKGFICGTVIATFIYFATIVVMHSHYHGDNHGENCPFSRILNTVKR